MVIATDFAKPLATIPVPESKKINTNPPSTAPLKPQPAGPNRLFSQEGAVFGDFRDDLLRDGYVVVKGAIPRERADNYSEEMMYYLENL